MSLVLAILALGMLVIVHEGGHYLVARWSGMRVERFSVGFGPAILKWRKAGTQFQIAPIPLGGFVQITGMNPHEEYDANDPAVYPNRPTWQRFLTILAGPMTNVIFSSVLIFIVGAIAGADTITGWPNVSEVVSGDPADGKIQAGDKILLVEGRPIPGTQSGLRERFGESHGAPVAITVERAGKQLVVSVTPKQDDKGNYMIGVKLSPEIVREQIGVGQAAGRALVYPLAQSKMILGGLYEIVTGKAKPEAAGPVQITSVIRQSIDAGWVSAFELLALLNVYLGLFNLLPLPALDGGRLVFLGYELATRRRPNPKVEAAVHMAGFVVLFLLMILVTFSDIKKLFT